MVPSLLVWVNIIFIESLIWGFGLVFIDNCDIFILGMSYSYLKLNCYKINVHFLCFCMYSPTPPNLIISSMVMETLCYSSCLLFDSLKHNCQFELPILYINNANKVTEGTWCPRLSFFHLFFFFKLNSVKFLLLKWSFSCRGECML